MFNNLISWYIPSVNCISEFRLWTFRTKDCCYIPSQLLLVICWSLRISWSLLHVETANISCRHFLLCPATIAIQVSLKVRHKILQLQGEMFKSLLLPVAVKIVHDYIVKYVRQLVRGTKARPWTILTKGINFLYCGFRSDYSPLAWIFLLMACFWCLPQGTPFPRCSTPPSENMT